MSSGDEPLHRVSSSLSKSLRPSSASRGRGQRPQPRTEMAQYIQVAAAMKERNMEIKERTLEMQERQWLYQEQELSSKAKLAHRNKELDNRKSILDAMRKYEDIRNEFRARYTAMEIRELFRNDSFILRLVKDEDFISKNDG